jgi:hypothetical protein
VLHTQSCQTDQLSDWLLLVSEGLGVPLQGERGQLQSFDELVEDLSLRKAIVCILKG